MKIRDLKPKESKEPPKVGEKQFGSAEHLCEACGRFGTLRFNGEKWICERCWGQVIPGQDDLPY